MLTRYGIVASHHAQQARYLQDKQTDLLYVLQLIAQLVL